MFGKRFKKRDLTRQSCQKMIQLGLEYRTIGIQNVLKFCFLMFQKQDGRHFVLFSNGLENWKTELLASLGCLVFLC